MPPVNKIDIIANSLYEQYYGEPMDEYVDDKEKALWRRKAQNHLLETQARWEHLHTPDKPGQPYSRTPHHNDVNNGYLDMEEYMDESLERN